MASKRIKGIQIPIGADTMPLQKALQEVNGKSKDLNGELKQLDRLLKLDPSNVKLLTQKQQLLSDSINNSAEKLKILKESQKEIDRLFSSGKIDEGQYREFTREVEKANLELNSFEDNAKKVNDTIKDTAENTNKSLENTTKKLSGLGNNINDLGNKMATLSASIVAGFLGLAKGTEELRNDLSILETNSNSAGISMATTTKAMQELSKVSKETDSNVEALSNILATGFNEKEILQVIYNLSGAVIKFPDTLKIESLADSLQETVATGKGVGQFAELLERLGFNIDDFNKELENVSVNGQEINHIFNTLATSGLSEVNKQFQESNKELVESNQASHDLKVSLAELGETVAPIFNDLIILIKNIVEKINSLDKNTKTTIANISLLVASISPILIIIGKVMQGTSSIIKNASKLKTSLVGTAESVGLLSKAFTFLSANPIVAVVAGISALCLLLGNSIGLFKSQTQRVEETQQAYADVKSELENVNSELETTNNRMKDLQAKGNLTLIEKDELSNLQKSNYELERRKQLLEDEERIKARSANNELYNKYKNDYLSTVSVADDNGVMGAIDITNEEYFKRQVNRYNELSILGKAMTEQQKKEYSTLQDELIKASSEFENMADQVIVVDDKSKEFRNSLLELSDSAYKALHPDLWKDNKLTELFNRSEFEDVKNELVNLSKAGKLDGNIIKGYENFNTELKKIGVTAEDVIAVINESTSVNSKINESIEYISSLTDEANDKTKEFSSTVDMLSSVYKTLNSEEEIGLEIITSLISKYPKYATEISKINDNKSDGIKLVNLLFEAEKKEAMESLEQTKAKILTETELLNLRLRLADISKSTWVSQEALNIYNQIKASEDATKRIQALQDNINKSSMSYKGSSSKGSTSKDDISKVYNERVSALEQEIFLSEKLQSTLKEGSKQYLAELDKQIAKNEELQRLTNEEANRLRGLGYNDSSPEVIDKTQYWWNKNDENASLYKNKLDSISSAYEEQNQILEDKIKLLDVEQSKYNNSDDDYIQIERKKYSLVLEQKRLISKQIEELEKSNIQGAKERVDELKRVLLDYEQERINIENNISDAITQNENDYIENVTNSREKLESAYINMRKRQLNETKKYYQEEIKMVDDVYNAKKKALQKERDDRYVQRETEDKTKSVSDIQSQLDLIKYDETQIAKRIQLEEELANAKRELDDNLYDTQYENQVQALEDDQARIKEKYQMEIDSLDEYLSDEQSMREEFYGELKRNSQMVYNDLLADAKEYGETTSIDIKNAWDICTESLTTFGTKQLDVNIELDNMATKLYEIVGLMSQINSIGSIGTDVSNLNNSFGVSKPSITVPNKDSFNNAVLASNTVSNNYYSETPIQVTQGNIVVKGGVVDADTIKGLDKVLKKNNENLMRQLKDTFTMKGIRPNAKVF